MDVDVEKHRNFVGEPIRNKPVTELPGVDAALGIRFARAGYPKALQVYGQFLVGDRNQAMFENFMISTTRATRTQASKCSNVLAEYYSRNS